MIFFYQGEYQNDTICLPVDSLHVRYGAGFFETLLYNGHMVCQLEAHLDRLFKSMETFELPYSKAPFEDVILELVERNGLKGQCARANIIYPVHDFDEKSSPLMTVRAYEPQPDKTLNLAIYPRQHYSYLCAHKSMNHLNSMLALRYAQKQGADDCLLTSPSGNVMETATATLVFSDGKNFVTPRSGSVLPSTSLNRASMVLPIKEKDIPVLTVGNYRHAYALNSLIGMKPITKIGDISFTPDWQNAKLGSLRIL